MPLNRAGLGVALALLVAAPAFAQMPKPAPMLHSPWITDCGPKALPGELCRLPVAFEADDAEKHLAGKDLAYWISGQTLNIAARAFAPRMRYCDARGPAPQLTYFFTSGVASSEFGRVDRASFTA